MRAPLAAAAVLALLLTLAPAALADPLIEVDGSGPATAQVLAVSGAGDAACSGLNQVATVCAAAAVLGDANGTLGVAGLGDAGCRGVDQLIPTCAAVAGLGNARGPVAASGWGTAEACQDHLYLTLHPCVAASGVGPASGWVAAAGVGDSAGFLAASGTGDASGWYAVSGCRAHGVVISVGLGVCVS